MPRCARDTRPRARIADADAPLSTWQLVKQSGADQKQRDLVRVHENTRKNLEQASMRSREISRDLEQEILAQILTYREGRRSA